MIKFWNLYSKTTTTNLISSDDGTSQTCIKHRQAFSQFHQHYQEQHALEDNLTLSTGARILTIITLASAIYR